MCSVSLGGGLDLGGDFCVHGFGYNLGTARLGGWRMF